MPEPAAYYWLVPGEAYSFNFAASPSGAGIYLGTVDVGGGPPWLAFGVPVDGDWSEPETRYYNPALLCTLKPHTSPELHGGVSARKETTPDA